MAKPRRNLDFLEKSIRSNRADEFRKEHLERHLAVVLSVVRQKDDRHSPAAELAVDRIDVGQGSPELLDQAERHRHHLGRVRITYAGQPGVATADALLFV